MRNLNIITYIIIGLAAVGFLAMLVSNPFGLFKWVATLLIFAVVVTLLVKFVLRKGHSTSSVDMRKYRQAVRQSKQRYKGQQNSSHSSRKNQNQFRSRKRPSHLRVIEGKKSKNKNRATF